MRAGRLRHRVMLQRLTRITDDIGGWTEVWLDVGQTWAEIRPVSGRAWMAAAQEQREVTAEVLIRPRQGIEAGMRVVKDDTFYLIEAALLDYTRCELKLMCKTVSAHA